MTTVNPLDFFLKQLKVPQSNKTVNTDKLDELYKIPKKESYNEMTHFQSESEGYEDQMDLLTLPTDGQYSQCLVVIDQGSRLIDCEALKDQSSKTALDALKVIYRRGIIKQPKTIRVDAGSHFQGNFKKGLENLGIQLIVAKAGRHRSLGLVERKNRTIGEIFHKMIAQNRLAGYESSKWVEYLPALVNAINQKTKLTALKTKPKKEKPLLIPNHKVTLLHVGDEVRISLDNPETIDGKTLHGKFRASDIKWSPKTYKITGIMFEPNQPIMYATDADHHYRTFEQLLKVKEPELYFEEPEKAVGDVESDRYEVEKILDRRKKGKSYEYLIKWKNYAKKDATWSNRKDLIKDIPSLIKAFDKKMDEKGL
jgi:transposase InsO family protein